MSEVSLLLLLLLLAFLLGLLLAPQFLFLFLGAPSCCFTPARIFRLGDAKRRLSLPFDLLVCAAPLLFEHFPASCLFV